MLTISMIFLATGQSFATTYYVDKNHTTASDSNIGTEAQPWATIGHATGIMQAGDTIFVKQGVYRERVNFTISGTNGNIIVLTAYPGHTVVIDATGESYGINLSGRDYIKIEGFEIINSSSHGILVNWNSGAGIGIQIINNKIHNCGIGSLNSAGVYYRYGDNGLISGNKIYDNGGDGIYIQADGSITINDNEIYQNEVDAIKAGGNIAIIDNNFLHDAIMNGDHEDAIQFSATEGKIRNNIIFGFTQDIYIDSYSSTAGASPRGEIFIYNNLVYNTRATETGIEGDYNGIVIDSRYNNIDKLYIFNNTIANKNNGSGALRVLGDYRIKKMSVINNIFYNSTTLNSLSNINEYDSESNIYYNQYRDWYFPGYINLAQYKIDNPGLEVNSIEADPLFVDAKNYSFQLQHESVAINKGVNLNSLIESLDILDTSRPQGSAWDIGAYEYTNSNTLPQPPTGLKIEK